MIFMRTKIIAASVAFVFVNLCPIYLFWINGEPLFKQQVGGEIITGLAMIGSLFIAAAVYGSTPKDKP